MPNPFVNQMQMPKPPVMPGQGAPPAMGMADPLGAPAPPAGDPMAMGAPPLPPPEPPAQDPAAKGFVPPSQGMGSMGGIDRNILAQLMAKTGGGALPPAAPPMGGPPLGI